MEDLELTILMPCLNEAETLASCIKKAKEFLHREKISGEVLIADNGSSDNSQKIAENCGARVVNVPVRGYGAALMTGITFAKGRFVIMGDADGSYDFLDLLPFMHKLRNGYDLVMGNRFRGGIKQGAMPLLNKYLGNPVLSLIGRMFFHSPIKDFHCGLRGFNRAAILKLDLQTRGMEFASEMVVKATQYQLKIIEVPTTLSPDGRSRRPHLRPWRDGWRHLRLLLLLSPRWLFLYPGIALVLLGFGLMFLLVGGPLTLGKYNFDIHTMLFSSLFIIVGLQAIFFAIFARIIAMFSAKLIPQKFSGLEYLIKLFTLEKGLMVGILFVLAGCGGSIYTFLTWMNHAFGPLMPTKIMRILIPSFTFLLAGLQIIFASFFVSVLSMYHRNSDKS